jgi:hypothetical protein
MIPAEVSGPPDNLRETALQLQRRGFRVLHTGGTISVQAPAALWQKVFGVRFERRTKRQIKSVKGSAVEYHVPSEQTVSIPDDLRPYVSEVFFQEPPEFF